MALRPSQHSPRQDSRRPRGALPRWWPLLLVLAACVAATCDADEPYDCSEDGRLALYEKRIAPLLSESRPKSCNQCHLSGLDLSIFVRDTPCNTMACMVQKGLVDLQQPDNSMILQWIDRASPQSSGITAQVLEEEREAVLQWIEMSAFCGSCQAEQAAAAETDPCGDGPPPECDISEYDDSTFEQEDPGGCSPAVLEQLFANYFYPYRKRCFPCHFEGYNIEDAPQWIVESECASGAAGTLNRLLALDVINIEDPVQSSWLLKPLDELLGGVKHGGGSKFHEFDDEGYQGMLYWTKRYANCQP